VHEATGNTQGPGTVDPTVSIRGLRKVYGDGTVALRGVDLTLGHGMLGLLGPNGAGKTTFLSILVLELEPSAGTLMYGGLDAADGRQRGAIRRRIGYLPQGYQPVPLLTGREYLLHCARLRGVPLRRRALAERVDALLAQVGLERAADRRSGTYSGGMKRRLGVAQALVHEPSLLVVDEPTAGLDPEERIRFRNLVCEVAEGTTVVLSTHIVEDVEATCPRLAVIAGGRLRFDGPPGELLARVEGELWQLPASEEVPPDAVALSRFAEGGEAARLIWSPRPVAGASPRHARLEDAYAAMLAVPAERGAVA
jgi:ABC-2 type transport system ATP-binding protein